MPHILDLIDAAIYLSPLAVVAIIAARAAIRTTHRPIAH